MRFLIQAIRARATDPRTMSRAVSQFMNGLVKNGKHPNTVRGYKKAINKFLKVNGLSARGAKELG